MVKVYFERNPNGSVELCIPSLGEWYTCKFDWELESALEDFMQGQEYELIEGIPST